MHSRRPLTMHAPYDVQNCMRARSRHDACKEAIAQGGGNDMHVSGEAKTQVPNSWKWNPGKEAIFTRHERNGQAWTLRVEEGDGYVTQQQAAWLLGVHLTQVNAWARFQQVPSVEIGGVSMIPLAVVTKVYRARRAGGLDTRRLNSSRR